MLTTLYLPSFQMYSGSWETVGNTGGPGVEGERRGDEKPARRHLGAQGTQVCFYYNPPKHDIVNFSDGHICFGYYI